MEESAWKNTCTSCNRKAGRKNNLSIQMTPRQRRKANALLRKSCCNYDGGNCIALDDGEPCICVQSISHSLCCTWFRDWVLPGAPALQAEITSPKGLKRCAECGAPFLAKSNRAKYCTDCACKVHRRQKTASDRKRRSNTDKQSFQKSDIYSVSSPAIMEVNTNTPYRSEITF